MAAITPDQESRIAASLHQQDREHPFLVRESDGEVFPNIKLYRDMGGFRVLPMRDPAECPKTHEDGLAWLAANTRPAQRDVVAYMPAFNIGMCTKDELVRFMFDEWGTVLNPDEPLGKLRIDAARIIGIEVPQAAIMTAAPAEAPAPEAAAPRAGKATVTKTVAAQG